MHGLLDHVELTRDPFKGRKPGTDLAARTKILLRGGIHL